ncbi:MAG: hypothetical protein KC636_20545, partial [Myxococcales bacterium]|nr:hypothetical protein [Myxococcales bacterium]
MRHILAEAMIQDSARDLDPEAFGTGALLHTIPAGFVLRAYLDESSPLWQLAAARPKEEYDAAKARNPDASLIELVSGLEVAPAEHLMLAPVYLAAIDEMIDDARADLEGRIAALQDHQSPDGAVLLVTPGPDGELGTDDDDTDCAASCPNLYATYFTYLALLAPRYDANQNELPSAFEKISTELRADLFEFLPRYLETIGNLSAKLNAPLVGESTGLDISKAELSLLFDPMKQWADDITTIDYDTLLYAVLPDWIIALDTFMQAANVDIALDGIVKAVFQPLLEPIKTAIQELIMAQAEQYIGAIVDELEAKKDEITGEYQDRLLAAAGMGLSGTALDHFYDSGLFVHAFNVTAATLANHAVVLPVGEDPIGVGPASFDASYTPAWMQAGVCDYLGDAIFPFGVDLRGLLTVDDGQRHEAAIAEDSPIECHQGALTMFADPATVASCVHVGLEGLKGDPAHVGSLTRAFPPELAEKPAECLNLVVPGLPDPPADPSTTDGDTTDGDTDGDTDGGTGSGDPGTGGGDSSDGSTTAGPLTGGTDSAGEDEGGGCGCSSQRDRGGAPLWLALLGLAFARRRRAGLAALALVSVGAGACGDDESSTDGSTAATTGDATTASTTAGSDPTTSTSESEGSSSDTDDPSTTDEPTTTDDPSTTDEPTTDPPTTDPPTTDEPTTAPSPTDHPPTAPPTTPPPDP